MVSVDLPFPRGVSASLEKEVSVPWLGAQPCLLERRLAVLFLRIQASLSSSASFLHVVRGDPLHSSMS